MIGDQFLLNLGAYSIQVACIVALGTLLHYVLRLDAPWLRHAYWRWLLAVCLVLPLIQGRQQPLPADVAAGPQMAAPAPVVLTVSMGTGKVSSNQPVDWTPIVIRVLAAGMMLRLLWTAMGLWQLWRLRRAGEAAGPDEHEDLQQLVGTRAEIRYVRSLDQPVTFGTWRPVIVLPDALRDHPMGIQRAVVCHELCHVRRHDWAWLLMEEAVRAVLWFHPGMWWLISRIQLTREEVVDAAAVRATGKRRVYVEALMAFADAAPLTPAAAFSRRRHLFRRMLLISKEAVMSSRRVVVSCAAAALIVAAGSWYAVSAFPLQGAPATSPVPGVIVAAPAPQTDIGPLERQSKPLTQENPVPRRIHSVAAEYPASLLGSGARALVNVRATLDSSGRVAEARAVRSEAGSAGGGRSAGPNRSPADVAPFENAAIDAVRQWQYDPPAEAPLSFNVVFNFAPDMSGDAFAIGLPAVEYRGAPTSIRAGGSAMPRKIKHVNPEYPKAARDARVQGVVILEATISPEGKVTDARILRSIPLLDQAARDAVLQWEFEPTLLNGAPIPVVRTITVQFTLDGGAADVGSPPVVFGGQPQADGTPVRVGGTIRPPRKITHVNPEYPVIAQQARVRGVVILEIVIDANGTVSNARILRSIPLLDAAALDAVRQWEFAPTLLNGAAVPVIMTATVQFSLPEPQ